MNSNPVRTAVELVDTAPSKEFLNTLHAQLLAEFTESPPHNIDATTSESAEEYIALAPNPARFGPNRRLSRILIAAAACVAVFVTGVVVANRSGDDSQGTAELRDVNPKEAMPLAKKAFISADEVGETFGEKALPPEAVVAELFAATSAAMPECAVLPSVGLAQPSTKAVAPQQLLVSPLGGMIHSVLVFATPEDASRAMDVIATEMFHKCLFDFFARMLPVEFPGSTQTSTTWNAPAIAPHGDRQVIFGERTTFTKVDGTSEVLYINSYVQIGRAIAFIDPWFLPDGERPLFMANKAIDASTAALESVFGH